MRAVGCRRCRLRSRRPPEETPSPFGRRAAPFLVCAGLVLVSRRRLSAIAAWVPASHMPLSPLRPSGSAPPSLRFSLRCPGAVCALAVWGGGRGRSVVGRSAFRSAPSPVRFPRLRRVSLLGRLRRPASLPPKVARRAPRPARLNFGVPNTLVLSLSLGLERPPRGGRNHFELVPAMPASGIRQFFFI